MPRLNRIEAAAEYSGRRFDNAQLQLTLAVHSDRELGRLEKVGRRLARAFGRPDRIPEAKTQCDRGFTCRHERERPPGQVGCGAKIFPRVGAKSGGDETRGEVGIRPPELGEVEGRLLEVVAEELVELDQTSAALLELLGEPLVQVGPRGFRKGVVRGVADQQVPETKAVFPGNVRTVRLDESAADERREAARDVRLLGNEGHEGAQVEDLALDRSALEQAPLRRIELVEPGSQKRPERGRDGALALSDHLEQFLDEEGVAAGGPNDARLGLVRDTSLDQAPDVRLGERVEAQRDRPGRTPVQELGSGRAREQDWPAGGEPARLLGTWQTTLTAADIRRESAPDASGVWRLVVVNGKYLSYPHALGFGPAHGGRDTVPFGVSGNNLHLRCFDDAGTPISGHGSYT